MNAPAARAPAPDPGAAQAADEKSNILVVDDLPEKLLVFGTVLEDLGQNLVFVRSGSEALREVLQREFAVILLDVNMPDIDGFETASLIRGYKRSAHTPIIFITSYADEMQTARGYSLGAVDYILSPVVPEVLRSKVKVFVELHGMQRQLRRQADERVGRVAAESARHAAEENDRRSAFLAHASRELGGSLDAGVAMRRLLELVVPGHAGLALLLLADASGQLDAGLLAVVRAGEPPQLEPRRARELPEALRAALDAGARARRRMPLDAAALAALPDAGAGAAEVVPLVVGERLVGVLVVAAPVHPAGDAALIDELAGRAAIAIDHARLYRELQDEVVERRAIEVALQEANHRKDEFLAMLSHELRNPLAPIRNALEVIRRIAPPDPKFAWAGDVMDRQVRQLTRLVEELLDVARISQGKVQLNREPVDLNAVVAQALETAQPFVEARRHSLQVRLPPTPVWLQGDFARLSQVVGNLLHNAAKFSEEGATIHLELVVEDGEAVVAVRDNGIGIDAALLPSIFELFAQGQRSLDRSQGGLGVGLTLARRLVELHGGRLDAASEGPGKGAEFRVRIPCISVVRGPGDRDDEPGPGEAHGCRILIVDDNRDAADSVARFLELEGHEVKTVADGREALASLPVFAPQVVVLDIGLPGLDGYEVARRVRELPAMRDALLLALTGYGQKEDRQRALDAGFDRHFVKPTDPRALVEAIAGWQQRRPLAAPARRATL